MAARQAPVVGARDSRVAAEPAPALALALASTKPARVVAPVATATSATLIASAVATAVDAERVRIRSILESPEAQGRERSAASMAYGGGFTSEQARSLLSILGKDEEVELDQAAKQIAAHQRRPS